MGVTVVGVLLLGQAGLAFSPRLTHQKQGSAGVPPVCASPVRRTTKVQEAAGIALARAQGPGSALAFRALGTRSSAHGRPAQCH